MEQPATPTRAQATLPLSECTADRAREVGGKARGLQDLIALGLPVPDGFCIPTAVYRSRVLPEAEIIAAYRSLGGGAVAVRSSAIAEDRADASFAGQQDTYLWVHGDDAVLDAVRRCWKSLYSERVVAYRERFGVDEADVSMAVIVQRMVDAAAAGVAMTIEPVTGDRDQIYVEVAHGLGEGVVRGDVEVDRVWLDKATGERREWRVAHQRHAHLVVDGSVQRVAIDRTHAAVGDNVIRRVWELARTIAETRGHAMDIEWAVDRSGDVLLLQARPETVWSNRAAPPHDWDQPGLMHTIAAPGTTWTTTNAQEAVPGVQTPLAITTLGRSAERSFRYAFRQVGALDRHELPIPADPRRRILNFFYGRLALQVDVLCDWADRLPGTDGRAVAEQIFSATPQLPVASTPADRWRRYPRIAAFGARPFLAGRRRVMADREEARRAWARARATLPDADEAAVRHELQTAAARLDRTVSHHTALVMGAVQPVYDLLEHVADWASVAPHGLMTGHGGHEETQMVADLWACATDRMTLEAFIERHGAHGPAAGDLASYSWRENDEPVRRLIDAYRRSGRDPSANDGARAEARRAAEEQLLSSLTWPRRAAAAVALRLAHAFLPHRSTGKFAFVQSYDIVRACARRLGEHLVARAVLDQIDDVLFLTLEELTGRLPDDARGLVARRRGLYDHYRTFELQTVWVGTPQPAVPAPVTPDQELVGTGASPGIVEGTARVVHDPSHATIDSGDILVARDTDPSWASLMYLSAGLVTDIGGVMSHTAVVARELGIPCIVNVECATRALRDGERIRTDGATGAIERIVDSPPGHVE